MATHDGHQTDVRPTPGVAQRRQEIARGLLESPVCHRVGGEDEHASDGGAPRGHAESDSDDGFSSQHTPRMDAGGKSAMVAANRLTPGPRLRPAPHRERGANAIRPTICSAVEPTLARRGLGRTPSANRVQQSICCEISER